MSEKLTKDNYKELLKEVHGDNYTFLEDYIKSTTPILCRCNTCGNEWKKIPYELIKRKTGCPICSNKKMTKTKSLSTKDFENKLIKLFGENPYEILSEYKNAQTSIKVKCKKCGYVFESKPYNLILKRLTHPVCKNCFFKNKKLTTEKYQKTLDDFFGKDKSYKVLEDYIDENTAILHKCNICNYEWKTSPANIRGGLHGKTRVCPSCNGMKRDDFKNLSYSERLKKIGSHLIPLEPYINKKTPILHKCNDCGYEWKTIPSNVITHRTGCPKCQHKITQSKYERQIINMIKSNSDLTVIERNRTILNGQELDIYIPEKQIAIEIDGLYWHCSDYKDKNYHLNKTQKCKEKGIRLIHIFDDENYEIVESKIKHILGLNKDLPKIYARKCYVEEISTEDKNEFLEYNHLQGKDKSLIKLGLWYPQDDGDILVSVMTFRKPQVSLGNKKNKTIYDYELSRFANDNDYLVLGSFGKLFKYFKDNYEWKKIVTYADLRWSVGGIYEKNNFKFDHNSKPNYFYFNRNTRERFHRYTFNKQALKNKFPNIYDDNKTEFQIMNETKIYKRIYDCGNMIYTYERNDND